MDRLLPGILVTLFALLLLGAMVWAWRGRRRRQQAFQSAAVAPSVAGRGAEVARIPALYVATTKADQPLERLTIPGLAFRGRAEVTVFEQGVGLVIPGEPETFVPRSALRSVGTSTWAIDRVVETGGLVRLDWTYDSADGPAEVESYLRTQELGDARRLIDAVASLIPQQEGTVS